jgi:hypothetical protein
MWQCRIVVVITEKDQLEYLDVDGRVILKCMLNKTDGLPWTR